LSSGGERIMKNRITFAKKYLNDVSFNCNACKCYEYGRNCKENRKSACLQVARFLNLLMDEKLKSYETQNEEKVNG
jgi:hypothetical protein